MVDHRPSSYGLQAPWLNRGPTTAALTEQFFFLNPLPEFTPRPTTCSDEVITEDSFSPSKISPGLRCLILLLYPEHIKNSPPSNGIICMKGNCPTIYLQLCHSIFSQGHVKKKRGKERKDIKKERNFCKGCCCQNPSSPYFSSLFFESNYFFFSLLCNILGGFFRETVRGS